MPPPHPPTLLRRAASAAAAPSPAAAGASCPPQPLSSSSPGSPAAPPGYPSACFARGSGGADRARSTSRSSSSGPSHVSDSLAGDELEDGAPRQGKKVSFAINSVQDVAPQPRLQVELRPCIKSAPSVAITAGFSGHRAAPPSCHQATNQEKMHSSQQDRPVEQALLARSDAQANQEAINASDEEKEWTPVKPPFWWRTPAYLHSKKANSRRTRCAPSFHGTSSSNFALAKLG